MGTDNNVQAMASSRALLAEKKMVFPSGRRGYKCLVHTNFLS